MYSALIHNTLALFTCPVYRYMCTGTGVPVQVYRYTILLWLTLVVTNQSCWLRRESPLFDGARMPEFYRLWEEGDAGAAVGFSSRGAGLCNTPLSYSHVTFKQPSSLESIRLRRRGCGIEATRPYAVGLGQGRRGGGGCVVC